MINSLGIRGTVRWEVRNADGSVAASGEVPNLVTSIGQRYYMERAASIVGAPAAITGMKLGTGSTTPAKTGAGAALVTYLANSHQAIDAGFPTSTAVGAAQRITYSCTFAAGKATSASTPITEVVLVNETLADATSAASATVARALITATTKTDTQILVVTWLHDGLG